MCFSLGYRKIRIDIFDSYIKERKIMYYLPRQLKNNFKVTPLIIKCKYMPTDVNVQSHKKLNTKMTLFPKDRVVPVNFSNSNSFQSTGWTIEFFFFWRFHITQSVKILCFRYVMKHKTRFFPSTINWTGFPYTPTWHLVRTMDKQFEIFTFKFSQLYIHDVKNT